MLNVTAFTLFVGVTFPFFGDLLGFFGGFGFAPTSYFVRLSYHLISSSLYQTTKFTRVNLEHGKLILVCLFFSFLA